MKTKKPLKAPEIEQAMVKLSKNLEWLMGITDGIYMEICPNKDNPGTWRSRARQALKASEKLGLDYRTSLSQKRVKAQRPGRIFTPIQDIESPWGKKKKRKSKS